MIKIISIALFSIVAQARETIVLDAGHNADPEHWGAEAYCETKQEAAANGTNEAALNMKEVTSIKQALDGTGAYNVVLTRKPIENGPSLDQRAQVSCQNKADMFISIHHDDTPDNYKDLKCGANGGLDPNKLAAREQQLGYKVKAAGFSVWVNDPGPNASQSEKDRYQKSLKFAKAVVDGMKAIGRSPSNVHLDNNERKSIRPIGDNNPDNLSGIWHQDLRVLRTNCQPAVLIELGVITNPDDLKEVTAPGFDGKVANVIRGALDQTFGASIPSTAAAPPPARRASVTY